MQQVESVLQRIDQPEDEGERRWHGWIEGTYRNRTSWQGTPGKLMYSRWLTFISDPRFFELSADEVLHYLTLAAAWRYSGVDLDEITKEQRKIFTNWARTDSKKAARIFDWMLHGVSDFDLRDFNVLERKQKKYSIAYNSAAELITETVLYEALKQTLESNPHALEAITTEHNRLTSNKC